ncbi:NlpC/P60 family protein [Rhodococcus koreensis]|uniref:NlpC/P60 family protein n=1 Tax=Rhodococcus koreensis TaxID=99653 RepID=A0A1H4P757_9NOCA|nr:NlpC/P60 family protein [Rhodococcus koreensis]
MIPIDLLTRPILDLLGAFGSGVLPAGGPADALRASSIAIDAVNDTGRTGISSIYGDWQGKGGTGAIVKTEEAQRATVAVSDRGNDMAAVVAEASEIVRPGMLQLQEILQSFISLAVAAGPALVTPPGQAMIVAAALDHLGRPPRSSRRCGPNSPSRPGRWSPSHRPKTSRPRPPPPHPRARPQRARRPPPRPPSHPRLRRGQPCGVRVREFLGFVADVGPDEHLRPGHALVGRMRGGRVAGGFPHGQIGRSRSGAVHLGSRPRRRGRRGGPARRQHRRRPQQGKEAADAVRNALSQQGVPYVWGGTSPGEGLDCSGLPQWAYGEAGVGLPRLAQEQNVGTAVDPGDLMPGDLAVWDGHVAMVIGNGQLV